MSRGGSRRVAVVTGGAGAIGGAIATRLAPDHTVVVLDRTGDVVVDLGDPDDVRRAADLVLERYGRCDVLVHAAAMVAIGPDRGIARLAGHRRSTSAHAVRSATVGGSREARMAGVRPASAPIRIAEAIPPDQASTGITTCQCFVLA
jgi:NAD(P)-dependent dehydrogenase (short-subunit alcohol dehydrogenase family)